MNECLAEKQVSLQTITFLLPQRLLPWQNS